MPKHISIEQGAISLAKRTNLDPKNRAAYVGNLLNVAYSNWKCDGKFAKGEEDYRLALKLQPGLVPAYQGMGMMYASEGKDEEALKAFQAAFKDEKDLGTIEMNYTFAQIAHRKGFMEDEVKAYKRMFRKDWRGLPFTLAANGMPDNETTALIHIMVGEDKFLNVGMDEARTEYLEAFNLRPKRLQTRVILASRLGHVGLTAEKVQVLTQVAKMAPGTKEGDEAKQELYLRGVTVAER